MAEDSDSKTEEPTDKKLADAMESGDVPMSREVTFLAALTAYLVIETLVLPHNPAPLATALVHLLDDPAGWRLQQASDAMDLLSVLAAAAFQFLLPVFLIVMAFGVGGTVVQNVPRIVPTRLMPDFSRISLSGGFARTFGPRGWTEFGKSGVKFLIVASIIAMILYGQRDNLTSALFADAADLPQRMLALCVKATSAVTLLALVIAGADFTWSRIHWRRDHRMSREEIKEEVRQSEGDRMMKARFRSLRMARARRQMLKSVPKATMVVVNPTHYAVALRYVRSEGGAPVVIAKGVDLIALKIREIAMEHAIPIVEDKPLARGLYKAVALDAVIPSEFYRAVAEIVHLLQEKRSSWPGERRRLN